MLLAEKRVQSLTPLRKMNASWLALRRQIWEEYGKVSGGQNIKDHPREFTFYLLENGKPLKDVK